MNAVKFALENPKKHEEIVNNAYQITASQDRWQDRAKDIIKIAEEIEIKMMEKQNPYKISERDILKNFSRVKMDIQITPRDPDQREYLIDKMKMVNKYMYWNENPNHHKVIFENLQNAKDENEWNQWRNEWEKDIDSTIDARKGFSNQIDFRFLKFMDFISVTDEDQIIQLMLENFNEVKRESPGSYSHQLDFYAAFSSMYGTLDIDNNDFTAIKQRANTLKAHQNELIFLYDRLADYRSKKTFLGILMYWLTMDLLELMKIKEAMYSQYFDYDIIETSEDEVFIDAGAFDGDTVQSYLENFRLFKKMICYEITPASYEKAVEKFKNYPEIEIRKKALGKEKGQMYMNFLGLDGTRNTLSDSGEQLVEVVSLDEDVKDKVTFIKMDIEGAERDALRGAQQIIKRDKPKLAISAYHGNQDLYRIPQLINEIRDDYKFYLRFYSDQLGPSEYVLYAK